MRKYLMVVLMLTMMIGCSQNDTVTEDEAQEELGVMVVNPIQEYTSLDEINKVVGTTIALDESMLNDIHYTTITDTVAQVKFIYNDYEMCLRASLTVQGTELAGVYGSYDEQMVDDYKVLTYTSATLILYNSDEEYRSLYIEALLSEEELQDIIETVLD